MASNNTIVKKSIQIDAGDTVRTVRSLKQEISDLRDQLLNLEQGTKEYDEVQKQLQEDVEDLNTVMGAHKEKAETLEGSYNDLQNQLKELKAAWKATNDEADRDVLGQKIRELNDQLSAMDQSIGDFHRNVGNYQSAWGGLTGVMEKSEKVTDDLEKGIKAFGTAMGLSEKQANALSSALKSLKDGFKIAKDIAKAKEETEKAAVATEGLAAAETTAAAQGKALATSQTATGAAAKGMAAAEGTATVATKGLSVAMNGLKVAIAATGIGALIVLIGTLSGEFDKLSGKIGKTEKSLSEMMTDIFEKRLDEAKNEREFLEHSLDFELRKLEAQGKGEMELLKIRANGLDEIQGKLKELRGNEEKQLDNINKQIEAYTKLTDTLKALHPVAALVMEKLNLGDFKKLNEFKKQAETIKKTIENTDETIQDANISWGRALEDIEVQKIKDANKALNGTNQELRKWSELVKDEKFAQAWHNLFQMDFGDGSPVDILKKQQEAAIALVQSFKGDTSEVERFFQQMISEAEAEWTSLVEKEKQIFDERLTPAQRLENEKQEWIEKANRWGMDSVEIVKYYDKKIQDELDKADAERKEAEEKAAADRLAAIEKQLDQIDAVLATQEKMDALFNPMFIQDTAAGDIEQEIEAVQRLYDTQMQYLNGLLESADLTEEAYAGIEERILSLTVAFNSQMNVLKKEMDFQGKNWAMLSRKGVASFRLMEDAAANFADVFQQVGLENSVAFKAFATAQALISAFLAANRVLAEEPGPFYMKAIAAAAALAAGIANVVSIWAVSPDGSNAGSMSTQQSATPVIGNSQPINYTRNITSAEEEDAMNAPIYVTVTDIEDGIEGRRAQVTNSSF